MVFPHKIAHSGHLSKWENILVEGKNVKVCDLGKAAAALRGKEGGETTGNTVCLVGVGTMVITLVRGIVAKSALLSQPQGM